MEEENGGRKGRNRTFLRDNVTQETFVVVIMIHVSEWPQL